MKYKLIIASVILLVLFGTFIFWPKGEEISPVIDYFSSESSNSELSNTEVSGGQIVRYSQENLAKAREHVPVILLYFSADWCSPCYWELREIIKPSLNQFSGDKIITLVVPFNDRNETASSLELIEYFKITGVQEKIFLIDSDTVKRIKKDISQAELIEKIKILLN